MSAGISSEMATFLGKKVKLSFSTPMNHRAVHIYCSAQLTEVSVPPLCCVNEGGGNAHRRERAGETLGHETGLPCRVNQTE